jgi:hypothetical protein
MPNPPFFPKAALGRHPAHGARIGRPAAFVGIFTPFFTFASDFINGRRVDMGSVAAAHHRRFWPSTFSCDISMSYWRRRDRPRGRGDRK